MERIRRNERLAAMTRILVESPNKIFTLGTFCEMFGAAKSTLSEDIDILRGVFSQFHLGQLDTVTGAAGGVRYRPVPSPEDAYRCVKDLSRMLNAPGRLLPGGFLYMADILAMPEVVEKMGAIIAPTVEDACENADVVMGLRIQRERQQKGLFPSVAEYCDNWEITPDRVALAKKHALVMHPGPMNRGVEIASSAADGPQSVIAQQVESGVSVRMALLYMLTRKEA